MRDDATLNDARKRLDEFFTTIVAPHLNELCDELPEDIGFNSQVFEQLALPKALREAIVQISSGHGPFVYRYYIYSDDVRATYEVQEQDISVKASSRVVRVIKVARVCLIIHEVLPNYDVEKIDPISADELEKRFAL